LHYFVVFLFQIRVFSDVISQSTWDNVLSESQRQHLMVTLLKYFRLTVVFI